MCNRRSHDKKSFFSHLAMVYGKKHIDFVRVHLKHRYVLFAMVKSERHRINGRIKVTEKWEQTKHWNKPKSINIEFCLLCWLCVIETECKNCHVELELFDQHKRKSQVVQDNVTLNPSKIHVNGLHHYRIQLHNFNQNFENKCILNSQTKKKQTGKSVYIFKTLNLLIPSEQ